MEHPGIRRRDLLTGALATAVAVATPVLPAVPPRRRFIDVHHHLFSPAMQVTLRPMMGPGAMLAGAEQSLAELDSTGVATAMISFPSSDIFALPEERLTGLIRDSNDYAMALVSNNPGRYGLFASLPLPYIDASLREIAYIFDQLHADGVLLITNYGDRWLGDVSLSPILAELNRRKAIVYTHPNAANCCKGLLNGVSDSIIEFETDTARTIASLLFNGAAERYQDIRFIFSHAGGTLPSLIGRFTTAAQAAPALATQMPKGVMHYLQSFHYDTAQAANPSALGALLKFVPASQVMFGTDFPYGHATDQAQAIAAMRLGRKVTEDIYAGNARRLLPRLRA